MADKYLFHVNEYVDVQEWRELVNDSPFSNPFQTPEFYNFCHLTASHKGLVCAVKTNGLGYAALVVADIIKEKGFISPFTRRAIIYGGPLLADVNQQEALCFLLINFQKLLKGKAIYAEIRNYSDYSMYSEAMQLNGWRYIPWLNVSKVLNFRNQDDLIASFRYSRRRETLMTIKAGLTCYDSAESGDIADVYSLMKDLYKTKIRLPLPSFDYFKGFMDSGLMKLFVVKDQDKVVGGSFCVIHENKAIYSMYYCGKRDNKPLTFPTHLALLAAMEYGCKNGMDFMDFMGAGKPETEYGVRNYKMGFRGEITETGRYLKVQNKFLYFLGVKAISLITNNKLSFLH